MKHVIYLSDKNNYTAKEEIYYRVRKTENRIYTDKAVAKLPGVPKHSPYYKEWQIRKADFNKLRDHLLKKNTALNILDVGSGNCWMANKLTAINNSIVTAFDLNSYELEQGARVFAATENLKVVYGDVFSLTEKEKFDVIVLAASVQYFKDIRRLVEKLLTLLKIEGEIHIIDSMFYDKMELEAAKKRSVDYYTKLGVPEMSELYYHHSFEELEEFKIEIKKVGFISKVYLRVAKGQNVFFPWVMVRN